MWSQFLGVDCRSQGRLGLADYALGMSSLEEPPAFRGEKSRSGLPVAPQNKVPRVSMTLEKWGHYPKYSGHDPIFKGS